MQTSVDVMRYCVIYLICEYEKEQEQKMVTSRIVATGAGIPSQVITNDDLAQIMDTSDEWIRQRTGIGERHISGGEDLSYYTTKAAR